MKQESSKESTGKKRLKPSWQKTDLPKPVKIELYHIMKDYVTQADREKALARSPELDELEKQFGETPVSRDTFKRLASEIRQMPASEVSRLPKDIQDWIVQLRPELGGQMAVFKSGEDDRINAEARRRHFQELLGLIEVLERQVEHLGNTTPTSVLTKSSLSLHYPSTVASEGAYKGILFWTADERRIGRIWLAVEEDRRFGFLRQHLQPSSLWTCYENWKRSWRQSLWFSYKLDAMDRGRRPSPKSKEENDRLFAKMKADHKRRSRCHNCLMAELVKVRSRGTLPGACDCCSA